MVIIKQKPLTLSLIIPVYNEEDYLGACLESIALQTVKPLEVVVVDNNSTDGTVAIARQYDFVRVIREKRQHQSYAQYTGFASARGDIIGRIDADTILPQDWVKRGLDAYSQNPDVIALTASGTAYDVFLQKFGELIFRAYYKISTRLAGHNLMWGANCSFRRDSWDLIKNDLLLRTDIWEDYDLGFCLAKHGKIENIKNSVGVSYRALHRPPVQQFNYQMRSVRTFYLRKGLISAAFFAVIWSTVALIGPVVAIDYYVLRPLRKTYPIKRLLEFYPG